MVEYEITSEYFVVKENIMNYLKECFPKDYMLMHSLIRNDVLERMFKEIIEELKSDISSK